jgi:uncharacterized protein YlxW (UPF0749 family)
MNAFKAAYEDAGSEPAALIFANRYMNAAEELKTQMQELCTLLDSRDKREKELREQRDQLLEAAKKVQRQVPIMASQGEYRRGQLHALEACREHLAAAIARAEKGGV